MVVLTLAEPVPSGLLAPSVVKVGTLDEVLDDWAVESEAQMTPCAAKNDTARMLR